MAKGQLRTALIASAIAAVWGTTGKAQVYDSMYPTSNQQTECVSTVMGNGWECNQGNADVRIFVKTTISDEGLTNIVNVLGWEFEPTDLTFYWEGSPVYNAPDALPSVEGETDIIYERQSFMPAGFQGMTWCQDAHLPLGPINRFCDQNYVAFRSATPGTDIACHETGHAMGLTHGQQAAPAQSNLEPSFRCMRNFVAGDDFVGPYNQQQINSKY